MLFVQFIKVENLHYLIILALENTLLATIIARKFGFWGSKLCFLIFSKRSDYANGTFAVFFFPREWRHCLFHTFSLKTSFCHFKGTSCVAEWIECLTAYHRPLVQLPAEVRMRTLEDYVEWTAEGR